MNSAIIIAEGLHDIVLLKKYLPHMEGLSLRWFAAQGKISLSTLARNILVHEGGPVFIVADSDTLKERRMEDERAMLLALLGNVAGREAFEVFCYMPEHEVVFFEAPQILQNYFKEKLEPHIIELGKRDAKHTLDTLLKPRGITRAQWYDELTQQDCEALRRGDQATKLLEKFDQLLSLTETEHS